jgi:hypothetical protein
VIEVGIFEVGIGFTLAALILYFAVRAQVSSSVPVLLAIALAPILGIMIGTLLAYVVHVSLES